MLESGIALQEAMQIYKDEDLVEETSDEILSKYFVKFEQDNMKKSRTIKANSDEEAFDKIYHDLCHYTGVINTVEDIKREFADADPSDGRPFILTIKSSDGQMLYESPFLFRAWLNDILTLIYENSQYAEMAAEVVEKYKDDRNNPAVFSRFKGYGDYVRELEMYRRRIAEYEDEIKQKFPHRPSFAGLDSWQEGIIDNIYSKR